MIRILIITTQILRPIHMCGVGWCTSTVRVFGQKHGSYPVCSKTVTYEIICKVEFLILSMAIIVIIYVEELCDS